MVTRMEDLRVLKSAEGIADRIWDDVKGLGKFEREVLGNQLIRAVDSIGANIAEAYGRYHYGQKVQFLYYARGSLFESKYWLNRCRVRGLLSTQCSKNYEYQLSNLARQINAFVKSLRNQRRNQSYKEVKDTVVREDIS
jgi:four helix bundle protein